MKITCNHVWRDVSGRTQKSKADLMAAIARNHSSGRWLCGKEIAWGRELEAEGKVKLCCDGRAATKVGSTDD